MRTHREQTRPIDDCLAGGGEMGSLMRRFDWSTTPVGPVETWPQSLKTVVRIILTSRYAMWMGWGPELTFFYNDAYRPTLGVKHNWALGSRADKVWAEIWPDIGPRIEAVLKTGTATWDERLLLFLERSGYPEETYHTFSYSPLSDDSGAVTGMLCVVTEDTERVIGERRLRTLRELGLRTSTQGRTAEQACVTAAESLAANAHDMPFVLVYLLDEDGQRIRLAGHAGLEAGTPASPKETDLKGYDESREWPFSRAAATGHGVLVEDISERFGPLPAGPWPGPLHSAIVLPITQAAQERLAGFLIAGISPRRAFDDDYRGFVDLVVGHIGSAIGNARAYEEERRRAEALAELDRAKTAFFSNVSHEFRTPLTLMLGPVEDAMAKARDPEQKEHLELAHRNALRLQKLVNTLLDFSRIEAGRIQARYEPIDVSTLTVELASVFRSAVEKAGIRLLIDCEPLPEPAYVDREMWEKIVLNLVSNAFKFTLEGEIQVSCRGDDGKAILTVRDTGTGISEEQLPHIFERFHRVEGARARTHEGTGIGLAFVQELVKLHGGTVAVESVFGRGTTFTVSLPLGKAHLPSERISDPGAAASTTLGAIHYVEEALRWLTTDGAGRGELAADNRMTESMPGKNRARILVADDNADLRDYLSRLLAENYQVEAVSDGEQAIEVIRNEQPDLVITDVMMPKLDGFGLLKALRDDPQSRTLPVIMLSARAGEEARVEGLTAGADDYLIKPFGARELRARVSAFLELTRVRKEVAAANERAASILESITDGFITLDREWRCTYMNAEAERINGMKRDEVIGRSHWEIFPDAAGTRLESEFRRAVAEHVAVEFENYYQPWDRWFQVKAYPAKEGGLSVYYADISARKRAEERLLRSEQRFRAAVQAVSGIVWTNNAAGEMEGEQPGWAALTGQGFDEYQGFGWSRAVHPDDAHATIDAWHEAVEQRKPFVFEHRVRRHDGVWRRFAIRAIPALREDDQISEWVGVHTDVTDQRQTEEALKEADRRKDEFLAMLAHELRNPLSAISNAVQVARRSDTPEHREWSQELIQAQVTNLSRMIDDLLDVSRITRGKIELRKQVLNIIPIVNSAVEAARPLIEERKHRLIVDFPPGPLRVEGDPTRLEQVIVNLLNNAAKYTESGGRIVLSAREESSQVVIRVEDNGIGMTTELLSRVFELFAQGDRTIARSEGGLGIGLTLVKNLVEMHGGTITAESEGPEKGSRLTVRLPVAKAQIVEPLSHRPPRLEPAKEGSRVLIVDDNVDTARGMNRLLKLLGNDVRVAHDGPSAIEEARNHKPDIILLDIGLPGMDGYQVAQKLREEGFDQTVIIAVSGYGEETAQARSRESGFDHHLIKPVDFESLFALINRSH